MKKKKSFNVKFVILSLSIVSVKFASKSDLNKHITSVHQGIMTMVANETIETDKTEEHTCVYDWL